MTDPLDPSSAAPPRSVATTGAAAAPALAPGLRLHYHYGPLPAPGGRGLLLRAALAPKAVAVPTEPHAQQVQAQADARHWQDLAEALAGPQVGLALVCSLDGGIAHALAPAPWHALARGAAAWFAARAAGHRAELPPPLQLAVPVAPVNPLDLFELTVELVLTPPATTPPEAPRRRVQAGTPGAPDGAAPQASALAALAALLESTAADPDCVLKLACIADAAPADAAPADAAPAELAPAGSGAPARLWLLRLCRQPQAPAPRGLRWTMQSVRHYAPRPLTNGLVSRAAAALPAGTVPAGIDPPPAPLASYEGLDLDALALTALTALDTLLAPPLRPALGRLDTPGAPGWHSELVAVREDLAGAIAGTLRPVLAAAAGATTAPDLHHHDEAVRALRAWLCGQAGRAYAMGALCQVAVQLDGRLDGLPAEWQAPRLHCRVRASESIRHAGDAPAVDAADVQLPLQAGTTWISLPLSPTPRTDRTHVLLDVQLLPTGIGWEPPGAVPGPPRPGGLPQGASPAAEGPPPAALRLLQPLDAALPGLVLPAIDLPLPLRQVAAPPKLIAQRGQAMPLAPPSAAAESPRECAHRLASGGAWQMAVWVSAPPAAQDRLQLSLRTTVPGILPRVADVVGDLPDHLARWWEAEPTLMPALQQALVVLSGEQPPTAAVAPARALLAKALARLAPLAAAWRGWCPPPLADAAAARAKRAATIAAPGPASVAERAVLAWSEACQPGQDALQLSVTWFTEGLAGWCMPPGAAPAPRALHAADGPAALDGSAGASAPASTAASAADVWLAGTAPPPPPPGGRPAPAPSYRAVHSRAWRRLTLGDLSITACPRLLAGVQLTRNETLLHDAAGTPLPTAPEFVYRGPFTWFPGMLQPLLARDERFDVAGLSAPRRQPLAHHLETLLGQLHAGPPAPDGLRLQAVVGFVDAPGRTGLQALHPVVLLPPTALAPAAGPADMAPEPLAQELARELAAAMLQWHADCNPGPGEFTLDIAVISGAADQVVPERPTWTWHGLYLGTADIDELQAPERAANG